MSPKSTRLPGQSPGAEAASSESDAPLSPVRARVVQHQRQITALLIVSAFALAGAVWCGLLPPLPQSLSAHNQFLVGAIGAAVLLLASYGPDRRTWVVWGALAVAGASATGTLSSWGWPAAVAIGAGVAAIIALWRRRHDERATDRLYVAINLAGFVLLSAYALDLTTAMHAAVADPAAYVASLGVGTSLAFAAGRLFAAQPWLNSLCSLVYLSLPWAMAATIAAERWRADRQAEPIRVDLARSFFVVGLAGSAAYFAFPVVGPIFAYADVWPSGLPTDGPQGLVVRTITSSLAPRNCMPSLHTAWVLLLWWHARRLGTLPMLAAAAFVALTLLATLGLGAHYAVDLVAGACFAAGIHALLWAPRRWYLGAGGLLGAIVWMAASYRLPTLLARPAVFWPLLAVTLGPAMWARRRAETLPVAAELTLPVAAELTLPVAAELTRPEAVRRGLLSWRYALAGLVAGAGLAVLAVVAAPYAAQGPVASAVPLAAVFGAAVLPASWLARWRARVGDSASRLAFGLLWAGAPWLVPELLGAVSAVWGDAGVAGGVLIGLCLTPWSASVLLWSRDLAGSSPGASSPRGPAADSRESPRPLDLATAVVAAGWGAFALPVMFDSALTLLVGAALLARVSRPSSSPAEPSPDVSNAGRIVDRARGDERNPLNVQGLFRRTLSRWIRPRAADGALGLFWSTVLGLALGWLAACVVVVGWGTAAGTPPALAISLCLTAALAFGLLIRAQVSTAWLAWALPLACAAVGLWAWLAPGLTHWVALHSSYLSGHPYAVAEPARAALRTLWSAAVWLPGVAAVAALLVAARARGAWNVPVERLSAALVAAVTFAWVTGFAQSPEPWVLIAGALACSVGLIDAGLRRHRVASLVPAGAGVMLGVLPLAWPHAELATGALTSFQRGGEVASRVTWSADTGVTAQVDGRLRVGGRGLLDDADEASALAQPWLVGRRTFVWAADGMSAAQIPWGIPVSCRNPSAGTCPSQSSARHADLGAWIDWTQTAADNPEAIWVLRPLTAPEQTRSWWTRAWTALPAGGGRVVATLALDSMSLEELAALLHTCLALGPDDIRLGYALSRKDALLGALVVCKGGSCGETPRFGNWKGPAALSTWLEQVQGPDGREAGAGEPGALPSWSIETLWRAAPAASDFRIARFLAAPP